ncbi:MAG: uncharacterized membrane protein YgdD (TMEM256/DUF423 family) [Alteromonadaceae bacterium]|jgi:uncharacterized membrane protein YgdD (TMEM256/DUF423 family)
MIKVVLAGGALFALLSVVLGAFGAHGLKSKISADMLAVFQTGVQYQFYHALGLILLGLLMKQMPSALLAWSGGLMIAGIFMFSGSLYLLALTGNKLFGPITPLGGLFFIVAWGLLLVGVLKGDG